MAEVPAPVIPPPELPKETLPPPTEEVTRSLSQMLQSQYKSREFNDIFASTELREREIVGLAGVFSMRFVNMILSTRAESKIGKTGESLAIIEERLAIKKAILTDETDANGNVIACAVNGMAYVCFDSYVYALGLLRQSLKRRSRGEAMNIVVGQRTFVQPSQVSRMDKIWSRLGVGRYKRQTYYQEK